MVIGKGSPLSQLTNTEISQIVEESLNSTDLDGKQVLVLIPDGTRTMPMPLIFDLFEKYLGQRVSKLDYLVALGTHQPMTDAQLSKLTGRQVINGKVGTSTIFNHRWDQPSTFSQIGIIPASEISQISNGILEMDVPVRLNKMIEDYDHIMICGPDQLHPLVRRINHEFRNYWCRLHPGTRHY